MSFAVVVLLVDLLVECWPWKRCALWPSVHSQFLWSFLVFSSWFSRKSTVFYAIVETLICICLWSDIIHALGRSRSGLITPTWLWWDWIGIPNTTTILQRLLFFLFFFSPGETLAFFNLTEVLGPDGKITSATHHYSAAVRAAAVSNKYRVLTLILYPEHNATTITFHLQGYRSTEQDKFEVKWKEWLIRVFGLISFCAVFGKRLSFIWGCTCGRVYVPSIYLHARWELL